MNYGQVPTSSTGRITPQTRPETWVQPTIITPPTTHPQPLRFSAQRYEAFDMPQRVSQPYYFAEQQSGRNERPKTHCPNCIQGIANFRLPHDPTDSVFCAVCRQPYHFCLVHETALPGMGLNMRDVARQQCQCAEGQDFLGLTNWNSCYHK